MIRARGFALPSAIFLLVILALLGAYMVSFSTTQNIASAQDVQGSRAYRAAQLGLEWAGASLCNGGGCATPLTSCPTIPSPLYVTPEGFSVYVSCAVTTFKEAGPSGDLDRPIFRVTATARSAGSVGDQLYIERELGSTFEFPSG